MPVHLSAEGQSWIIRFTARLVVSWRIICAFIHGGRPSVCVLLVRGGS